MSERIRTTISIPAEVYEIFKQMADAGNMSVSRCMGDWLQDTGEAAQLITIKMQEAKKAPIRVLRELKAMVAGMNDQVDLDMVAIRKMATGGVARSGASVEPQRAHRGTVPSLVEPPSGNTGVLVPPVSDTKSKSRKSVRGEKL